MGPGLADRLKAKGIQGLVTTETDPDRAVAAYLAGRLPLGGLESHEDHQDEGHGHRRHGLHHHASPVHVADSVIPILRKKDPT